MLLSLYVGVQSRAEGVRSVRAFFVSLRVSSSSHSQRPIVGSYLGNGSTLRRRKVVSVDKDGTPIRLVNFCRKRINHNLTANHHISLHRSTSFPLFKLL